MLDQWVVHVCSVFNTVCVSFVFFSWLYKLFNSYIDKKIKEILRKKVRYSSPFHGIS